MKNKNNEATAEEYSKAERWILAHDIRDNRRLSRVYRILNREGLRLQYSVYLISGNRGKLEEVIEKLKKVIDEADDDIRVYALTVHSKIWGIANQFQDDGCTLCDEKIDLMFQEHAGSSKLVRQRGDSFSDLEKVGNPLSNSMIYNGNSGTAA